MAQMTPDMAKRIVEHWEATREHYGITAWEECQLAHAFLKLHTTESTEARTKAPRSSVSNGAVSPPYVACGTEGRNACAGPLGVEGPSFDEPWQTCPRRGCTRARECLSPDACKNPRADAANI